MLFILSRFKSRPNKAYKISIGDKHFFLNKIFTMVFDHSRSCLIHYEMAHINELILVGGQNKQTDS